MPNLNDTEREPVVHTSVYPPESLLRRVKTVLFHRGSGSFNRYALNAIERQLEEDEAKN